MAAIPASILRELREGQDVSISAVFDGRKYDARRIDLPKSNPKE
jgi:cold shock CspA family protein